MKEKMPFIKTSDENIAKILRENNYPELDKEGTLFVFVNIGTYENGEFSKIPVTFSRILCL